VKPGKTPWIESPSEQQIELLHPMQKTYELPLWALGLMAALVVGLKIWLVIRGERKTG
jgi:hypothetical protein